MPANWVKNSVDNSQETKLRLKEEANKKKLADNKNKEEERRVATVVKTLNAFSGWSAITKFANDFDVHWEYTPSEKLPNFNHTEDEGYEHPYYITYNSEGFDDIYIDLKTLNTNKRIILKIRYTYNDHSQTCNIFFSLHFRGANIRDYSVEESTPISANNLYDFLRQETIEFINLPDTKSEDNQPFWKKLFS